MVHIGYKVDITALKAVFKFDNLCQTINTAAILLSCNVYSFIYIHNTYIISTFLRLAKSSYLHFSVVVVSFFLLFLLLLFFFLLLFLRD